MAGLVLDASVLIALYNDKDFHHKWAIDLMFQSTAETFHMASLNLAEVAVQPAKLGITKKFFAGISQLNLEISGLGEHDALELATIRATTNVPMPDCCVIQLAQAKSSPIATADRALGRAAQALGIEVFQP
jgi:predicted nucleic acid-binding protein